MVIVHNGLMIGYSKDCNTTPFGYILRLKKQNKIDRIIDSSEFKKLLKQEYIKE